MTERRELKLEGLRTRDQLLPWEKVYRYLRILIDTNRFGAIGKDKRVINALHQNLLTGYLKNRAQQELEEDNKKILEALLKRTLFDGVKLDSKKYENRSNLFNELGAFLTSPIDYFILGVTIKEVLIPTNRAVEEVPAKEITEFAKTYALAQLDAKKEMALSNIIREWDVLTEDLALNKERDLLNELFSSVRTLITTITQEHKEKISERDLDVVLTAVCQEFERRTGQKRKQRAGADLESGCDFIFKYFNFKTAGAPEHFSSSMEVDNWLRGKDGWYVGVSLKRTLRERWKQAYIADTGFYDKNKIKHIVHIINNDSDLSDTKIAELGSYRHLFFLADNSNVLAQYRNHTAIGKYVFPMTCLISKLHELLAK